MGTYAQNGWDRERELRWCADHGRFTPFGGETVPSSARTPIAQVVRELELLHATYLNSSYHRGTLEAGRRRRIRMAPATSTSSAGSDTASWRTACEYTKAVNPGGTLRVELDLRNVGFAAPHMPRQVALVLSQGDRAHRVAPADADPRRWTPEAGTVTLRGDDADTGRRPRRPMAAGPAPRGPLAEPERRRPVRDPPGQRRDPLRRGNGWNVLSEDVEIKER